MPVSSELKNRPHVGGNSFAALADDDDDDFQGGPNFYNPARDLDAYVPSGDFVSRKVEKGVYASTEVRHLVRSRAAQLQENIRAARREEHELLVEGPRNNARKLAYLLKVQKTNAAKLAEVKKTAEDFEAQRFERREGASLKELSQAKTWAKPEVVLEQREVVWPSEIVPENLNQQFDGPTQTPRKKGFEVDRSKVGDDDDVEFDRKAETAVRRLAKQDKTFWNTLSTRVTNKSVEQRKEILHKRKEYFDRLLGQTSQRSKVLMQKHRQIKAILSGKPKNVAAFPNAAYELLTAPRMGWRKAHPKEINRLLGNANVWEQDLNYHGKRPLPTEAGSFAPLISLSARGVAVFDDASLQRVIKKVRNPNIAAALTQIYREWSKLAGKKSDFEPARQLQKQFAVLGNAMEVPTRVDSEEHLAKVAKQRTDQINQVKRAVSRKPTVKSVAQGGGQSSMKLEVDYLGLFQSLLTENDVVSTRLVQLLCMCVSLQQCRTKANVVANIVGFVSSVFPSQTGMWVRWIRDMFSVVFLGAQPELQSGDDTDTTGTATAFSEFMSGLSDRFEAMSLLSNSTLAGSLWSVLSCVSISSILISIGLGGDFISARRWKEFLEKFFVGRDGIETFFQRLLRFISFAAQRIKEAYTTGDWSLLWSGTSFKEWVQTCQTVLEDLSIRLDGARPANTVLFKANLQKGLYPNRIVTQLTDEQRVDLIDELLVEHASFVTKFTGSGDITSLRTMEVISAKLINEKYVLKNNNVNGQYRVQPWAVFIHGKPGAGKSEFSELLHIALAKSMDLPNGPDSRYSITRGTNFFDGVHGQWMAMADDIDQSTGSLSYDSLKHPELVCQLVNRKPFMMEQADVANKGKVYCNFLALAYLTNFRNARLDKFIEDPKVFWRRFRVTVDFKVRKEFATPTGRLDPTKLDGSNDYWTFGIGMPDDSLWDDGQPFESFPFKVRYTTSMSELMRVLVEDFKFHIDSETRRLVATSAGGTLCPVCYVKLAVHPRTSCSANTQIMPFVAVRVPPSYVVVGLGLLYYGLAYYCIIFAAIYLVAHEGMNQLGVSFDINLLKQFLELEFQEWMARRHFTLRNIVRKFTEKTIRTWPELVDAYERAGQRAYEASKQHVWIVPALGAAAAGLLLARQAFPAKAALQSFKTIGPLEQGGIVRNNYIRQTFVRDPLDTVALATTTFDDLAAAAAKRLVRVQFESGSCFGVQICKNIVLIPGHGFCSDTKITLPQARTLVEDSIGGMVTFSRGTLSYSMHVLFGVNAVKIPGREYVLVCVPGIPPIAGKFDLLKHMATSTVARVSTGFDRVALVSLKDGESQVRPGTGGLTVVYPGSPLGALQINGVQTKVGDCGSLYIVQAAKFAYIAGYHVVEMTVEGMLSTTTYTVGEELTSSELIVGIHTLSEISNVMPELHLSSVELNS